MTEEQKKRFQEKYDGWYPTEKQFQYGKKHCNLNWIRKEKLKQLVYVLSQSYAYKDWDSVVVPLLEDLKAYAKMEEEMRELYGVTD